MATFKSIADTDIASGAAVSQSLMQALKDNITACFEGDITSPQLQPAALGSATSDFGNEDHFCVASSTAHATADNDSLLEFRIRKTGSYILHYVARMGETNPDEGGDVHLLDATAHLSLLKASAGSSSFSAITNTGTALSITSTDAGLNANVAMTKEISLTAGDQIRLKVNETANSNIELSITAKIFIENDASFFSATALGVMTST